MRKIGPARRPATPPLHISAQGIAAALLCTLLIELPLAAGMNRPSSAVPIENSRNQLQGEQRTLHALNRLTFGPRPGDVAEVQRVGLKAWFDRQLDPQRIEDSALDARLAAFPAIALPQTELVRRYPSPQMLKQIIQRNDPLPSDPVEHAIYADGIAFYKDALERKAAGQAASPAGDAATMQKSEAIGSGDANTPTEGTPQAEAGHQRAGRVDLLGSTSGYSMTRPKKATDGTMAGTGIQDGAMVQQDNAAASGVRGHARHDERAFPEAATVEILALPPDARVRRILALDPAELVSFRHSLSQGELTGLARDLSPQQKEIFAALQSSPRMIGAEVLQSRLERDVYSNRQVEAVMTDFWLNHFNVYLKKNQNEPYLLPAYERDTIRPHALGRFEDLLVATARSPAMLMYLDNWQSVGPDSEAARRGARYAGVARNPQVKQALKDRGLNENYARELMELHTIGVGCEVSKDHAAAELDSACGNGYTQADVTEVAKVFSGWTIDRPSQGGEYSFEERRHEPGKKTVLGRTIHESGEKEGLEVLHTLAMSPATAKFLSTKLAIRFVSDNPPPALVDRMSRSYLASGGEIRSVLRTMFDSPEFWSSDAYRSKVKTPIEFVVSALRATGAEITNAVPLVQSLDRLGMPLYGMQTPNGYSWKSDPWVSTGALVSRMNFALVFSAGKLQGTRADWPLLLGAAHPLDLQRTPNTQLGAAHNVAFTTGGGRNADLEEVRLEKMLLGSPASDRTRSAVLSQSQDASVPRQAEQDFLAHTSASPIDDSAGTRDPAGAPVSAQAGSPQEQQVATVVGLLLGSPEFQRR